MPILESIYIMKTCLCNVYPLEPHFYIAKLVYTGVYLFLLFLLQNIDCGYSLERLGEAVLMCTHSLCFEQKQQKYQNFSSENVKSLKLKNSLYMAWASFRNVSFDLLQVCPT